ncbi:hypothetical protein, variant [Aphanomyces invadans]|nr:hypothetical protein, variant [Aphanomyces invadans]ETV96491.1 hypothetical protein, variant [Aphanomyces invadans]|eukprot:XP_008874754.1 hypothetical protein, variant [Aphanomyces invadans]
MALVARSALEESNSSVLVAAIDVLHACLIQFDLMTDVDQVEWTPRDAQGHARVVAYIDEDEVSDVKDIADPIQALLFTQLPPRLLQLIDAQQAPLVSSHAQLQLLEICVVIAMHSPRAAAQFLEGTAVFSLLNSLLSVATVDTLLKSIEMTAATLLWILRLCQADKIHAQQLLDHQVLASTKVFLAMRFPPALLPLQTLTMRIWRVCLSYRLDQPSIAYLFPLLCGYDAKALTQSVDSISLEPWPRVMQECILDALVFLIDEASTVAFLPFFIQQASELGTQSASAVRFLAATYPLLFTYPSLEPAPFVSVWPTLRTLSTNLSPQVVEAIVALHQIVAANPHSLVQVDLEETVAFIQSYVPSLTTTPKPQLAVAAALLEFVISWKGVNDSMRDWVRATAYPLLQCIQPGQHKLVRQLLRCVLEQPPLVAIYEALLCPPAISKNITCHTLQPLESTSKSANPTVSTLPPPPGWVFALASRLHSMDSQEESIMLTHLVKFLTVVETRQPELFAAISPTDKVLHLAHVYLWEAEAWRDCSAGLHALIHRYIRQRHDQDKPDSLMDATERIVSVQHQSVSNLLSTLVQVFCNVSFGDKGLAWILTMYLQPNRVPIATQFAVWNEVAQLQCLHLLETITDLESVYVVDDAILDAYLQSVVQQHLTAEKGMAMYRMVVHHIAHFCFTGAVTSLRKQSMLLEVFQSKLRRLIHDMVSNPTNETTRAMLTHAKDLGPFAPYSDVIQECLNNIGE